MGCSAPARIDPPVTSNIAPAVGLVQAGGNGDRLVRVPTAALIGVLDPQTVELADRLAALSGPDVDIDDVYDDLAGVLAGVYDAHVGKGEEYYQPAFVDRDPATELLAPLAEAFAHAARAGVIDERFMRQLTGGDMAAPAVIAQLLVFGDPLDAGNPAVTAGLASVVLADGFHQATMALGALHSPWGVGEPFARTVSFNAEEQIFLALAALVDHPEAAWRFLAVAGNQAALLDRADDGYGLVGDAAGLRHLPSEVIEAGLLVHPLQAGMLDGPVDADGAYTVALRALVEQAAGRDRVAETAARGLAVVLAPHYDSLRAAVDKRNAREPDILQIDQATYRAYLANVAGHDVGLDGLSQVFASWTAVTYGRWAPELAARAPIIDEVPLHFTNDTFSLGESYRLLEQALKDANVAYAERQQLLFFTLDRATALARSRALKATKVTGPVSFLAGEAASWTTDKSTTWVKDAVLAAGPRDVENFQAALARQMPLLGVRVLLDTVPADQYDTLVPVPPAPRERVSERDASLWERVNPFHNPDRTIVERVPMDQWTGEELDAWITENQHVMREAGEDHTKWWLNAVFNELKENFPAPLE